MEFNFFFYIWIFIFGLAIGSFLNSVIYRLQSGESFFFTRSFCPSCKNKLAWRDLIPLLSFVALKGKCRYCQKPISFQYPFVELFTGLLFIFVAWNQLTVLSILYFCYLLTVICFLIIIFVYDLKHFIIPDEVIYPAIAIAFLYRIFEICLSAEAPPASWQAGAENLGFGILPSIFFLAIILLSRGQWMGLGDFKLAIFMGFFLGFPNIVIALFLAFFIGAIIGIGLVIARKKTLKSEVPFGPFLVTGTFIALFWGEKIINWVLNFI